MQVSTLGMLAWPVSAQVGPNGGLLSLPIFSFSSSLRHKYLSQVFLVRQARLEWTSGTGLPGLPGLAGLAP